jgi:hypothetical protein
MSVQGVGYDDTAMNGISFKCKSGQILTTKGSWGSWGNWYTCPGGFTGAKFKNEKLVCMLTLFSLILTILRCKIIGKNISKNSHCFNDTF